MAHALRRSIVTILVRHKIDTHVANRSHLTPQAHKALQADAKLCVSRFCLIYVKSLSVDVFASPPEPFVIVLVGDIVDDGKYNIDDST